MTSVPVRFPQISNWSMAAARKVSAAHSRDRFAAGPQYLRQFADGRRFARAVDADHQNNFGSAVHGAGLNIGVLQDGQQFFFQQPLEFFHVLDLLAVGFVAELFQDLVGSGRAQVGADQRGFKIVERGPVNFFADGDYVFDAFGEVFAGARDRLLHAVK